MSERERLGHTEPPAIGGRYQAALDEGRMAVGVFCAMDGYAVSHTFAAAGYDFVIIDLQHAAFTWPEVENMAFRVRSTGAAVFLRTASTEAAARAAEGRFRADDAGDPRHAPRRHPGGAG